MVALPPSAVSSTEEVVVASSRTQGSAESRATLRHTQTLKRSQSPTVTYFKVNGETRELHTMRIKKIKKNCAGVFNFAAYTHHWRFDKTLKKYKRLLKRLTCDKLSHLKTIWQHDVAPDRAPFLFLFSFCKDLGILQERFGNNDEPHGNNRVFFFFFLKKRRCTEAAGPGSQTWLVSGK